MGVVPRLKTATVEPVQVYGLPAPYAGNEAWLGGSIVACLSTFRDSIAVSKQDYDEHGPRIFDRRCP